MNSKTAFSGDLSYLGLTDILQILKEHNRTGILRITGDHNSPVGIIYFVNGGAVNATSGPLVGLEAVYSLFGWVEGRFEFYAEKVFVDKVIKESPVQISLNAMRMLDEGKIKKIGASPVDVKSSRGNERSRKGIEGAPPIIKGPPVDYMYVLEEEKFQDGARIVQEGGYGNWIWVVLDGVVEISRKTLNGSMGIARLGEGCFIGTLLSLFHSENRRSATVTAIGDAHLGMLDTQRLSADFTYLSPEFRGLLGSFTQRLIKITDTVTDLSMKQPRSDELIKDKKPFMENESYDDVFAIKEGEAHVIKQDVEGFLPLLTLEKQDVFGHVPFIDIGHEPHSALIFASKDLKTEKIDMESIQSEFDQLPCTLMSLVYDVSNCISKTTQIVYHL